MPRLSLITSRMDDAVLDTALSTAILEAVAAGDLGPTLRLFVPGRVVAFGSQDRTRPGYRAAVDAVTGIGFDAIERLAGGRAAVFHEGTLAFAWATAHKDPKLGIEERFREIGSIVVNAITSLGSSAEIGEVPGEYCPGRFSVQSSGRKVMGVGQRLIKGAAHVGGVIVAHSPELVNEPLIPAYGLLDYEWSPDATGALGRPVPEVEEAVMNAFGHAGWDLEPIAVDPHVIQQAESTADRHRPAIA